MASNSSGGGDHLVRILGRTKPARVVVVVDGESREVSTGTPRAQGRWQRVARLARELAGDAENAQVEMRDGKNVVIERVSLDAEDVDADDDDDDNRAQLDTRDERILTLVVSAQRAALEEQRVLLGPVLAAYTDLARGYAQYAAQVAELVRVAASARMEATDPSPSPADQAMLTVLGQLANKSNGAPPKA